MDELFTFTTVLGGGISAIAPLWHGAMGTTASTIPDVYPIISLGVDSISIRKSEYGRIKFPEFTPAGYEPKAKFLAALEAAGLVDEPERAIGFAATTRAGRPFSDEVPF